MSLPNLLESTTISARFAPSIQCAGIISVSTPAVNIQLPYLPIFCAGTSLGTVTCINRSGCLLMPGTRLSMISLSLGLFSSNNPSGQAPHFCGMIFISKSLRRRSKSDQTKCLARCPYPDVIPTGAEIHKLFFIVFIKFFI